MAREGRGGRRERPETGEKRSGVIRSREIATWASSGRPLARPMFGPVSDGAAAPIELHATLFKLLWRESGRDDSSPGTGLVSAPTATFEAEDSGRTVQSRSRRSRAAAAGAPSGNGGDAAGASMAVPGRLSPAEPEACEALRILPSRGARWPNGTGGGWTRDQRPQPTGPHGRTSSRMRAWTVALLLFRHSGRTGWARSRARSRRPHSPGSAAAARSAAADEPTRPCRSAAGGASAP